MDATSTIGMTTQPGAPAGTHCPSRRSRPGSIVRRQQGFNLIELMVAVTIVGILAAIAINFYDGAIIRARIAEALMLVTPMKTIINESFAFSPELDACSGIMDITIPTDSVLSATCTDDGTVATVRLLTTPAAGDLTLDFVNDRTSTHLWQCEPDAASAGFPYLPRNCQH